MAVVDRLVQGQIGKPERDVPLNVGLHILNARVEVAATEGIETAMDQRDVLLGWHRLLRQPGGFEGRRTVQKVLLPHDQAFSKREQLEYVLADRNAATGPVSRLLSRDEDLVSKVKDLFRLPADVLECITPIAPQLVHPTVAVEGCIQIRRHQLAGWPILARGIPAQEDRFVISAVGRSVGLLYAAGDEQSPEPRAWRKAHEAAGKNKRNARKSDRKSLIGRTALTSVVAPRRQRDSDSSQRLHVLLRHRPRSISRVTTAAAPAWARSPSLRIDGTARVGHPCRPAGASRYPHTRYRGDQGEVCGEPCGDDTRTYVRNASDRRRLLRRAPSMGVHPQNPCGRPVASEGSADPQAPPLVGRTGPPPDTWPVRRADSVARGPGVLDLLPPAHAGGMGESGERLTPAAAGRMRASGRPYETIRSTSRSSSATTMRRSRSGSTNGRSSAAEGSPGATWRRSTGGH